MCSIFGVVGSFGLSREEISEFLTVNRRMTKARGPDESYCEIGDEWALGFNRLSFRGSSLSARQPVHSDCGRYLVMLNGEIYNYVDLAVKLGCSKSEILKNVSDTKVCCEVISKWGVDRFFSEVDGMFSLAIIDLLKCQLILVRDPCGQKPLFYSLRGSGVVFSSDSRGLARVDSLGSWDLTSIQSFLALGYTVPGTSMFKDIFEVMPGVIQTVQFERGFNAVSGVDSEFLPTYRALSYLKDYELDLSSEESVNGYVRGLIDDSVRRTIDESSEPALFFSGGVDSTLVADSLLRQGIDFTAITFGFSEKAIDESVRATAVADAMGFKCEVATVGSIYPEDLARRLIASMPTPLGDTSCLAASALSGFVRDCGFKYALTGDGGDELFSGYQRYVIYDRIHRLKKSFPRLFGALIHQLGGEHHFFGMPKKFLYSFAETLLGKPGFLNNRQQILKKVSRACDEDILQNIYLISAVLDENCYTGSLYKKLFSTGVPIRNHEELFPYIFDRLFYLPADILRKSDICGMSASLECRAPLISNSLIEFSSSATAFRYLTPGKKQILTNLFKSSSAHNLIRKKQGFTIPLNAWITGDLQDFCDEGISNLRDVDLLTSCGSTMAKGDGMLMSPSSIWNRAVLGHWIKSF